MAQVQRIEVVTGVERRRRFTDEEKVAIIQESLAPGASIATVARRHDLAPRLLYTWKSRLKSAGLLALPSAEGEPTGDDEDSPFVRVEAVHQDEPQVIRVHIYEEFVVEFPAAMEPRRLAAVVHALRS